jgi:hypothetical protein
MKSTPLRPAPITPPIRVAALKRRLRRIERSTAGRGVVSSRQTKSTIPTAASTARRTMKPDSNQSFRSPSSSMSWNEPSPAVINPRPAKSIGGRVRTR